MNLAALVDEYLYEVARLYQPATEKKYGEILSFMLRDIGEKTPIEMVGESDLLASLGRWKNKAKSTQALSISVYKCCFEYAVEKGHLYQSPARRIKRPKLPKPEDRKVVIVSTGDVQRMFGFCRDWGDEICLGILAYTGARRNAVSMIRWKDVDLKPDPPHGPYGWITMQEKGNKYVDKPIPYHLRQIIDRAPGHELSDYLIPNKRPSAVKRKERKNDIIYERVKDIAKRAGVEAHVHALRAAFAVFFLENHKGSIKSLQELLGHESIETTRHYTRNLNKKQQMAEVVDLDWGALSETSESTRPVAPEREIALGVAPLVSLSALSEGVVSSRETPEITSELAPGKDGWLPVSDEQAQVATSSLSALSPAEYPRLAQGAQEVDGCGTSFPAGESALGARHEQGHERLAAHHVFPGEPVEAHTGFEPVLLLKECIHALPVRIGHHFGHRTGHYLHVC